MLFEKIFNFFLSLNTAIWLLASLLFFLFAGAYIMPAKAEFQSIHSTPLLQWLAANPAGITWWLWCSIAALSLMAANTLFCSIESLIRKRELRQWLLVISPQVIHIGFLFILIAHLLSSIGGFKGSVVAYEGSKIRLPNNVDIRVKGINVETGQSGYVINWGTAIEYLSGDQVIKEDFLGSNSPSFYKGFGIYMKNAQVLPFRAVLLEVSREPGAVWALIGGIFFMAGTLTLILLKIKKEV